MQTDNYTRETEHGLVATDEFWDEHDWLNGSKDEITEHYNRGE